MQKNIPLTFILFKYFPYGGLQRDFFKIAQICSEKGYKIRVYTMQWQGNIPNSFEVKTYSPKAITNCKRILLFCEWVRQQLHVQEKTFVIGFNKTPMLDIYYAADTCFLHKAHTQRSFFYRFGKRFRCYSKLEKAIFDPSSSTKIMLISEIQKKHFSTYYQTPQHRMVMLPPGIEKDRCYSDSANELRTTFRYKHNIKKDERLLILLGSGFKTKGLDRALIAVSCLPKLVKYKVKFFIIGKDKSTKFKIQAKRLGIENKVQFWEGTNDVPALLQGADGLIHPAYNENTGTVLLEAMVAGLPVLCTDVCGYAKYIDKAHSGLVLKSPFCQNTLNQLTYKLLFSNQRTVWSNNAIQFSKTNNLHDMPSKALTYISKIYNNKFKLDL